MSDEQTIEAIRKRNELLYGIVHNYLAAHGWLPAKGVSDDPGVVDDAARQAAVDTRTLLAEIEARDAEIERLQDPILCSCGMPADVHKIDDGMGWTWWPFEPYRTTLHSMMLMHRAPADVFWQCEHGRPLHPASGDDCWTRYVDLARKNGQRQDGDCNE